MKKLLVVYVAVTMAVLLVVAAAQLLHAKTLSFKEVYPFTLNGRVGFFDQSQGRVYLYDPDFKNCVLITQLNELGQPLVKVGPE